MATCPSCQSDLARMLFYRTDGKTIRCSCDRCGTVSGTISHADVYFRGPYYDPNIVDENDSSTWNKGTYVESREHKAELFKKHGLRESGDRVHGARNFDKRRTYL